MLAVAPHLVIWTVPVALPMILAPVIIAATSRPMRSSWLFQVPEETSPSPVLREWRTVHEGWTGAARREGGEDFSAGGAANVLG